jgi:putative efflux protein, MATE family
MSFDSHALHEAPVDNSFWPILREAVRGSSRDFTQGPIGLAIFLLAVPMILEMSMESLFAIVDIFFVAKLGADSIAIVGLTESVMALIYAVAFGLAISATATVSRRIGEKDEAGAARSAAHVIYLGVIVSLIISLIGIVFAPAILTLLGAKAEILDEGARFMRIMVGGNAAVLFIFLLNAIFRGAGDAAIAMRVLILSNGLNMILSPMFIFGVGFFPQLGVIGAAVGTTIGRSCGVLFAASMLFRPGGRIHIDRKSWKLDSDLLWRLIRLASTGVFQLLIATASWTALMPIMAGFGDVAIAGYVIALRVVMFALLPSLGLSNAAATMVGQNLGAGKPERSEASVWKAHGSTRHSISSSGSYFGPFRIRSSDFLRRTRKFSLTERRRCTSLLWICILWIGNGVGDSVQRSRRHMDADVPELFCILGTRNSAGLSFGL